MTFQNKTFRYRIVVLDGQTKKQTDNLKNSMRWESSGSQNPTYRKSSHNLEQGIFSVEVLCFILRKTIVFQGFRGVPSFNKGLNFFGGGGQDANFNRNL